MDARDRKESRSASVVHHISYKVMTELDELLEGRKMRRISVASDGNCLYHALAHQLSLQGVNHSYDEVRKACVSYLQKNPRFGKIDWMRAVDTGETREEYLHRNSQDGEWSDDIMLMAASSAFGYVIKIVTLNETVNVLPNVKKYKPELVVAKISEYQYVSVEKKDGHANNMEASRTFVLKAKQNPSIKKTKKGTDVVHLDKRSKGKRGKAMNGPGLGPSKWDPDQESLLFGANDVEEEEELPLYDRFTCEPPEDDSRTSSNVVKFFTKTFKLSSYLIFGGLLFGGALISKACLMILVNSAKVYPSELNDQSVKKDHDVIRAWSFIVILLMLLLPEVLTMMYSLYRIIMKAEPDMDMNTVIWGGFWEFLHAVGEGILFFKVLPYLDATVALLMLPLVGIIPNCIHIQAKVTSITHNERRHSRTAKQRRIRDLVLAVVALVLQLCGLLVCFACFFGDNWLRFFSLNYTYIWAFSGIVLTSCRYWENFVTGEFIFSKKFSIKAQTLQNKLDATRFKTSFIFSLMKCGVLIGFCFLTFVVLENETYTSNFVNLDTDPYSTARYNKIISLLSTSDGRVRTSDRNDIIARLIYVFVTQGCCSFAAYFFGRVACLTLIQREAYAFPTVLVTPVIAAFSAALAVYRQAGGDKFNFLSFVGLGNTYKSVPNLSYYIDFNNKPFDNITDIGVLRGYWTGIVCVGLLFGWLSLILFTVFIWNSKHDRLQRTEVIFTKALYGGPLIDQVLMLNRRQFESNYNKNQKALEEKQDKKIEERRKSSSTRSRRRSSRRLTMTANHKFTPQLFLCATMWHETEQEMTQILTSLMRLDKDQGSRRENSQKDPDYYNFQIHVMFDDAMETPKGSTDIKTNKFVQQLCTLIPLAANKVDLGTGYDLSPPVIYPTPYGGRLEFILPHGNLMVVHLKDKAKIRHRKRWSQCMYMYYILGYLQATKKAYKLDDVFLLALDGDVDFQPHAVHLLLDRMKRNPDVGAACGRIHPTGSGPVVWFQKFEYAVGHWLQKTAEHVLGCVLCSPGCFSMFRGSAIVDVNVAKMYTTKATEALHYVQWDQGEDRWLCTLLLKQGWRIEYSAASDSYTFAPEEFKEFYNQRRRWGPSTMANIFDILMDAKLTVKNNIYISWGYISYQIGLMVSSILGPATVVMIVQGAYQYVFHWSSAVALVVSLIPVIIFIILCYTTSADTQVAVAGILTILYALVMMAVIVGVVGAMATNSILDPNNIFMIMLVGLYAFTGLVHPKELMCLIHGILYYLCVPSAFIFLMVYSLTNMNNVSWGTREVKTAAPSGDDANVKALEEVATQKGKSLQLGPNDGSIYDAPKSSEGYYSCGLGNLCQCALCISPQPVYQPVPTEVKVTAPKSRKTELQRRTTRHARESHFRKYSQAKARQITGMDVNDEQAQSIERRLSKKMSVAQLRRISSKMGDSHLTTAKLRRMSTQQRRMSKRSQSQHYPGSSEMSSEAAMLSAELQEEQPDVNEEYFTDEDDSENEDQDVGLDRLEEEGEEMLYWLIEGSLEDGIIEYLDNDEREFWKYMLSNYLYPLDENKDEKARIKENLRDLRNKMTGAYFLANALWLVLNFALQLTITDISISFYINGEKMQVNPVSFLFLIFFLIILLIQFTCMLMHRWSTALHTLSTTSLKWNDSRDGYKNVKQKDIENADIKQKRRKARGNGSTLNPITGDVLDKELPEAEDNFTFGSNERGRGESNPTYDTIEAEHGVCMSSDESDNGGYAEVTYNKKEPSSPMNPLFSGKPGKGSLYGATAAATNPTFELDMYSSQKDLIPTKTNIADVIHHLKPEDEVKPQKHAHFAASSDDDEGNTSF
uniref:chitin synthase n=1 Tax=Ciona robusta TaxID=1774208 RepID=A0A2Z5UWE5_9ASCI|nr:chitin synthase [Ciona robusta]